MKYGYTITQSLKILVKKSLAAILNLSNMVFYCRSWFIIFGCV